MFTIVDSHNGVYGPRLGRWGNDGFDGERFVNFESSGPQYPYAAPSSEPTGGQPEYPVKHSGLGIASFVISLVTGVGFCAFFVVAGVLAQQAGDNFDQSPAAVMVGLSFFALVGAACLGFVLGVAGLFQRNRFQVFAILGILFNIAIMVVFVGLLIIGMMVTI